MITKNIFYLTYENFPWFKEVSISKILNVEQPYPGHLYWPEIDVDLSIDIIEHPERFILKAKILTPNKTVQRTRYPLAADL